MRVEIASNGRRYMLLDDVIFPHEGIIVPCGYATDFASVPKFLWWLFPPTGYYQKAALLHDWAYEHHSVLAMSRWDCDSMFLRQMKRDGVRRWTRYTMWAAVRLFGAKAYESY